MKKTDFNIGDKVKVVKVVENGKEIADEEVGKDLRLGDVGTITKIDNLCYPINVVFPNGERGAYNPEELALAFKFKVGDKVRIRTLVAKRDSTPPRYLEGTGVVTSIDPEGRPKYSFRVEFPAGAWEDYTENELEAAPTAYETGRKIGKKIAEEYKAKIQGDKTRIFPIKDEHGETVEVKFVNIRNQLFRSYHFPISFDGGRRFDQCIVRVDAPEWIYVTPTGSHRIIDKNGRHHYIPAGWKHLWWLPVTPKQ